MIEQYDPTPETWTLFDAACSGTITANQVERLEAVLRGDEHACNLYLSYFRMHAGLSRFVRLERCRAKILQSIRQPNMAVPAAMIDPGGESRDSTPGIASTPLAFPTFTLHGTIGYFSDGMPLAYLIATMVTGLGLLIGSLIHVSRPEQVEQIAKNSLPMPTVAEPKVEYVGKITGTIDCKWADPFKAPVGYNDVSLGRKFNLESGLMEITYDTGAKIILQGPVTYEVESKDSGYLSVGKLTARVEKKTERRSRKAEGSNPQSLIPIPLFSIRTPTATVTDLGTEFGVEVGERGVTKTHVFVGEVEFVLAGEKTNANEQRHSVRAGQIARVEGDKVLLQSAKHSDVGETPFVRTLPRHGEFRAANAAAYAALVLSLQPAVYYRMEQPKAEKDRCVAFDSAVGSRHGTIHLGAATGQLWPHGRFGDALHLRGPMVGDYAVVPDYPQSKNNQLTVAAWVLAESRLPWASIAKNWGNKTTGQFHFGLAGDDGEDLHVFVCQADGKRIEVREGPANPLPVDAWQHVVLVVDGSWARLYRNGKEVGAAPCQGLMYPSPVAGLAIGCKLGDDGVNPDLGNPGFWRGRIDELAIFHHALPSDAIRKLYQYSPSETKNTHDWKTSD